MVFDVNVAMTWVLFLALFPIAFFWFRRAWRIAIRRDFSEVALKRGESPPHPERYAPYAVAINLLGGVVVLYVVVGVLTASMSYQTWSSLAGITIWMKIIADFILSRQAHPFVSKDKAK
jgi:hypothetical protein